MSTTGKFTKTGTTPIWEIDEQWQVLTAEEREQVNAHSRIVTFKRGEILYHEGDAPNYMMMLVSGKLKVYKEGVSNRNQIIRMLKPYDLFGYRSVIAQGIHNTSVSAVETSTVYQIEKDVFLRILRQNSALCFLFVSALAHDLGNSDTRSVSLTQKHIRGRLAESLLYLKNNYGLDEDQATISMYLSREDIANLSNMTTSNAIRTLTAFAEEGIIGIDGRKIKILDLEQLVRISRLG